MLVISTSASGPGEAPWLIGFSQARSAGLPDSRVKRTRAVPERVESRRPVGWDRRSRRKGLAFDEGALAAVLVPRTRRKPSDLPRRSDPIETDQGSDSTRTRVKEPEILNVLNLPRVMLSVRHAAQLRAVRRAL